jgi:hypothetical protein
MRYLGALVEAGRLRPMRESAVSGDLYDADDVLPLARQKLGRYSGRIMAMPLSVQVPLVGLDHNSMGDWPAIVLLARAAAYSTHPRQEAVLFDSQTMAARIAEPPFVRALEEWQDEKETDASSQGNEETPNVWFEYPGAEQVFNWSTGEWETVTGGGRFVPFLAGGTLLAVTASTRNSASAFALAAWLASAEAARQLEPIGKGTLPVRRSQLDRIGRWMGSHAGRGAENSQLGSALLRSLSRDEALVVPRIPGSEEYLAALAAAVERAMGGEVTAADALADAARTWDQITDRIGRDAQRQAYLHDLGIAEP